MAVKLFVSDIDGTILIPQKKISERNIAAIATGRMYKVALPVAQALGDDFAKGA